MPRPTPTSLPATTPTPTGASGPLLRQIARGRWALFALATGGQAVAFVGLVAALARLAYPRGSLPMVETLIEWGVNGSAVAVLAATAFLLAGVLSLASPPKARCGAPSARPLPAVPDLTVGGLRRAGFLVVLLPLAAALLAWSAAARVILTDADHVWAFAIKTPLDVVLGAQGYDVFAALAVTLVGLVVGCNLGRSGEPAALPPPAAAPAALPPLRPRQTLAAAVSGAVVVSSAPLTTSPDAPCPVCGCAVGPAPVVCPRCRTPHHFDCHEYAGGCAIFGCRAKERPSAVPSSVFSSSSSLPSPSLSISLSRELGNWLVLYRAHWMALCTAVTGVVLLVWSVALPLDVGIQYLFPRTLGNLGLMAEEAGRVLGALGLSLYLILLALEAGQRRHLGDLAALDRAPSGPATRALVDRLDPSAPGAALHALLAVLALGSATLAVLTPLAMWWWAPFWSLPFSEPFVMAFLVLGGLLPLALLQASVFRAAHVRSLQNRLAATLKQGGGRS